MTLTRDQLDSMTCQVAGCSHQHKNEPLYLHSRCHLKSPLDVTYFEGDLFICCHECREVVAVVKVAES